MSNIPQIKIEFGKQGMTSVVGNQANTPTPFAPSEYKPEMSTFNTAIAQKMQGDIALTQSEAESFKQIPNAVLKARELDLQAQAQCAAARAQADKLALEEAKLKGATDAGMYFTARSKLAQGGLKPEEESAYKNILEKTELSARIYGDKNQWDQSEKDVTTAYTNQASPILSALLPSIQSAYASGGVNGSDAAQSFLALAVTGKRTVVGQDNRSTIIDDPEFAQIAKLSEPVKQIIITEGLKTIGTLGDQRNKAASTMSTLAQTGKTNLEAIQDRQKITGDIPLTPYQKETITQNAKQNQIAADNLALSERRQSWKEKIDSANYQLNVEKFKQDATKSNATPEQRKALAYENLPIIAAESAKVMPVQPSYIPGVTSNAPPETLAVPKGQKEYSPEVSAKINEFAKTYNDVFAAQVAKSNTLEEAWRKTNETIFGVKSDKWKYDDRYNSGKELTPQDRIAYANRFYKSINSDNNRNYLKNFKIQYLKTESGN